MQVKPSSQLNVLSWNGIALEAGGGFPSRSLSLPKLPGGWATGPAGKDNIPILQLKWLSGKMKNLATFQPYACLQRHQPLL
jgi:hypothetical protein